MADTAGGFRALARELAPEEAASTFEDYARRHRLAFHAFVGPLLLGRRVEGTSQDLDRLARSVPLLELRPDSED